MSTNALLIGITALVSFSSTCVVAYYCFTNTRNGYSVAVVEQEKK